MVVGMRVCRIIAIGGYWIYFYVIKWKYESVNEKNREIDTQCINNPTRNIYWVLFAKKKNNENPRLILVDFSSAIKNFVARTCKQHLNGSFCIVSGGVIDDDLQRTIIHFCSAHMMNLCKKHASNKAHKDIVNRSQVHFAMRVFGRLIYCTRLSDASKS